MRKSWLALLGILAWTAAPAQIGPQQEKELFSRVDGMLRAVSEITGFPIARPVPRAVITREKIREYIEQRIAEAIPPGELRAQEILLKKLGFVPADFDLKSQMVDLLSEQAAAFYDFKQKKLFLAAWTPSAMHDVALVHELAHAAADQQFNLQKFILKSGEDDAATARGAVVEGQASWVMTEYLARQMGRSLKDSPELARGAAPSAAEAAKIYPVFGASPLYIQETLLFPYTKGIEFQQAVFEKLGRQAFAEVFRRPPASSQQVMRPKLYFEGAAPARLALPSQRLPAGYKKILEGTLGELDFQIMLRQYVGEEEAQRLSPRWRGSRYALWENARQKRVLLGYSVEWQEAADAAQFLGYYKKICAKKWKQMRVEKDEPAEAFGTGDDGRFVWRLAGKVFTSLEGL